MKKFSSANEFASYLRETLPKVNQGWTEDAVYLEEICNIIEKEQFIPQNPGDLLRFFLEKWTEKNPGKMVGEKTPAHNYYTAEIFKVFPDAKFILMVRDPRAIALSEKVKLENNPNKTQQFNLFNFMVRWETAHQLAKKWKSLYGNDRILYLKYEDLVSQPEATVKQVCKFLDIQFQTEMLEVGVVNSSFKDKEQTGIKFNLENLDRWKQGLSPQNISLIQYYLSKSMKELAYECDPIKEKLNNQLSRALKMRAAKIVCSINPAMFHHFNRNQKYKEY